MPTESASMDSPLMRYRLRHQGRRRSVWVAPLVAAAATLGWRAISAGEDDRHWMLIARDSSYSISLDTTRIGRVYDRVYEVWYRTDHHETRYYRDKAFDRETVKIQIACREPRFRVIRSTLSLHATETVMRQENTLDDVRRQRWHAVDPGTTDADAAGATCIVADSRWRGQ